MGRSDVGIHDGVPRARLVLFSVRGHRGAARPGGCGPCVLGGARCRFGRAGPAPLPFWLEAVRPRIWRGRSSRGLFAAPHLGGRWPLGPRGFGRRGCLLVPAGRPRRLVPRAVGGCLGRTAPRGRRYRWWPPQLRGFSGRPPQRGPAVAGATEPAGEVGEARLVLGGSRGDLRPWAPAWLGGSPLRRRARDAQRRGA